MRNSQKQREAASKINYKHGYAHKEKLYSVWKSMKRRCCSPNDKSFKNYGARGIKVCDEWTTDYVKFRSWAYRNGYEPNGKFQDYTIDRINNDGNYCPANCRIVSNKVQANNKRNSIRLNERYKECPICHKQFAITSRTAPNKTCSKKCASTLQSITMQEKYKDKFKKECPICHNIFEDRSGHFSKRVCCSHKCANILKSPLWEYNGETHRVIEWAEIVGINAHCLLHRKELGWDIDKILSTPLRSKREVEL